MEIRIKEGRWGGGDEWKMEGLLLTLVDGSSCSIMATFFTS